MKLLSTFLALTEAQAIGLGWFVGAILILGIIACWCKVGKLIHHDKHTDQQDKPVDPPLSN